MNDINDKLLNKSYGEYYFAIIQNRDGLVSENDYQKIISSNIEDDNSLNVKLFKKILSCKNKKVRENVFNIISNSYYRYSAIITIVDGKVYNVASLDEFEVDLNKKMIIHYDNLNKYYNENDSYFKIYNSNDIKKLKENKVFFVPNDDYQFKRYSISHFDLIYYENMNEIFIENYREHVKKLTKSLD